MRRTRTTYPTMAEVNRADRIHLARWYRFLPGVRTSHEAEIIRCICARLDALGGMTPAISKQIWLEPERDSSPGSE